MKNLLNYQSTEYDCGPVSLMNGIRYLFEREEIYPDLVKFIMSCCMDQYGENGEFCKSGTSHFVMRYLSKWMNHFSKTKNFPISCEYLENHEIIIEAESKISTALQNGAAVVLLVHLDVWHYILLTGIEDDKVLLFDPYYEDFDSYMEDPCYQCDEIQFIYDQPKKANRCVSMKRLNQINLDYYAMGPVDNRLAIIMQRI